MKPLYFFMSCFLCICGFYPAFAENVILIDDITVSANREAPKETSTQIIPLDQPCIISVPDALKNTSGIDIQRRSILTPKNSQVKIRGLDERRSQILLDGRSLNGTGVMGGYFVDWSSLSLIEFENIVVSKGAFSAKYGNTLGGVINMKSAPPKKGAHFQIYSGYKNYQTYLTGASTSYATDHFYLSVNAGHHKTDGHLRNSDADRNDLNLSLSLLSLPNQEIKFNVRYSDGDFNMPVENMITNDNFDPDFPESIGDYLTGPGIKFINGHGHGDNSYFTKKRYELDLLYTYSTPDLTLNTKVFYNTEDRKEQIWDCIDHQKILERESVPDRSWGYRFDLNKTIQNHTTGFGLTGNFKGYGGTDNTFTVSNYYKPLSDGNNEWDGTKRFGIYIDDQWKLSENINIYAGIRYDIFNGDRTADTAQSYTSGKPINMIQQEVEFDESTFLPKISITFQPVPDLLFHGRIARATRFPDNPAFYWYYGGYQPENDPNCMVIRNELTYEDAIQYELGFSYKMGNTLSLQANAYYYNVNDYIRWIFGYSPSRLVYNIDKVDFHGIEVDINSQLTDSIICFSSFTFQKTKKYGDVMDASNEFDDRLSELPEKKFNAGLRYLFKDNIHAEMNVRWVDKTYVPYGSDVSPDGIPVGKTVVLQELDDYMTVDLSLKVPMQFNNINGNFTIAIENLFDEQYMEEYGFPASGQTAGVYLEMTY